MKLKLAALFSFIIVALAGCGGGAPTNTANSNSAASPPAVATSPAATVAQAKDPNMVEANADSTATTGGTKEGCKCSAVGMACNTKEGEKGCCGGKDGSCSTMQGGVSKCCAGSKDGASCCSTAKTASASTDHKNMKGM